MANKQHLARLLREGVEAWNKWRSAEPGLRPDLREADLGEAYLVGANLGAAALREANLRGADLGEADLREAYLVGADLGGADLGEASLSGADLGGASLREAYLVRAYLGVAHLGEADLSEADLSEAICYGTNFFNVDLAAVRNLERIRHAGPSSLGGSTLPAAKGKLPDVFLRGCGLTNWEIAAAKLHDPELSEDRVIDIGYELINIRNRFDGVFVPVFISYSHKDSAFAKKIHDALQAKGIRCWLDVHDAIPGQYLHAEIDRGLRASDRVLLCCSKDSLKSAWVEEEIIRTFALERKAKNQRDRLRLIPLDLDGSIFKWRNPLAPRITERLACNFREWEEEAAFTRELARLLSALRAEPGK